LQQDCALEPQNLRPENTRVEEEQSLDSPPPTPLDDLRRQVIQAAANLARHEGDFIWTEEDLGQEEYLRRLRQYQKREDSLRRKLYRWAKKYDALGGDPEFLRRFGLPIGPSGLMPDDSSPLPRLKPPGRKRRRTGGGYRSLGRVLNRKAFMGPLIDPAVLRGQQRGKKPYWPQKPLTSHARDLLAEYLRRKAFWQAIEDGVPIQLAGKAHLPHLKPRRFYEIANEFDAHTWLGRSATKVAQAWLIERTVEGMNTRRIGLGRETCRDPIADLFYTSLAGGPEPRKDLMAKYMWAKDPLHEKTIECQIYDFLAFARPQGRPRKDG
jgi:hypothetical protein